jgi:hypothetical protein
MMERRPMRNTWIVILGFLPISIAAQTTLPDVNVTAPKWEERHGGYLISSNFEVDTHMSAVIYPAEPFQQGDILSVRLTQIQDDEYFVLQECATLDCTQAHILRVWNAYGALGVTSGHPDRVWIPHEGKFFMWMQRFPMPGGLGAFTGYEPLSPPLVLNPTGPRSSSMRSTSRPRRNTVRSRSFHRRTTARASCCASKAARPC